MNENFDIFNFRCFIQVVESKNITKAANELFISQPTLSRRINALEAMFGTPLLIRSKKGIELTPEGLAFYEQCKQFLATFDAIRSNAGNPVKSITGQLAVGYQRHSLGIAVDTNTGFLKQYPDVSIKSHRLGQQNLIEEICSGSLDIGIVSVHEAEGFEKQLNTSTYIGSSKMALIVSSKHRLADRKSVPLSELASENFIMLDRTIAPVKIAKLYEDCKANGFTPKVLRVEQDYFDIITDVVMLNAVSVTPISRTSTVIERETGADIRYIDLEGLDTNYPLCAAYRRDNRNPIIPLYIKYIEEKMSGGEA